MKKYRKKLLTAFLAIIIANGLYNAASFAVEKAVLSQGLSLRTENDSTSNKPKTSSQSIELKGGVKIDSKQQLVTLKLVNSDLRQVLRLLADKAGKNIIMDDSVPGGSSSGGALPSPQPSTSGGGSSSGGSGTISLDLVNVTVNKAFEYIMTLKQLAYTEDGNTIIIAHRDRAAALGLNTAEIKPIKIKYVDAERIASFLNSNIFNSLNKPEISRSAIVTSNPGTNEVYIFGNKNDYELAKKIISQLDKQPQLKTFNVNFANTQILAQKICTTVFQSTSSGGSSSGSSSVSSGSGPSTSASQLATVCSGGGTSGGSSGSSASSGSSSSGGGSGGMSLASFTTPSYMVMADTGLNQITIYGGTQEQVNLASEMIKNFDKKEPQVYLEISIIELNEEGSKVFNNAYRLTNSKQTINLGGGTTSLDFTKNTPILNWPDIGADHPIFNNWDTYGNTRELIGTLTTVITNGKGRMLANPRILASNNTESTINISEQYVVTPSATTTASIGNSGAQTTTAPIIGDAGIQLSVTPKISPNGYVTLNLSPSYSSQKPLVAGSTTGLTKSRTFDSKNVRVKDGDTLVIAGLIQETENSSHSMTPILSDIPIIGTLFKDQSTGKSRSELIFMITPRIIKGDAYEEI